MSYVYFDIGTYTGHLFYVIDQFLKCYNEKMNLVFSQHWEQHPYELLRRHNTGFTTL